jgi:NAD(P)-dependent dehydrogenase (short-subunit alcohol dehydrogenase family)
MAPSVPELFGTTYPCFSGKLVLLTGIGQTGPAESTAWGNGAATARLLVANGARVFGCDIDAAAAARTCTRLEAEFGPGCCGHTQADVTSAADVAALVDACERWGGGDSEGAGIDYLVNNVGLSRRGGPADLDEATWDAQLAVNLKSVYLLCHAVLPRMEARGRGAVVSLSSVAGLRYIGKPQVAYSAAKAAVIQFTKTSAVVYADRGIRLNCVVPGLMHTPLVEARLAGEYAGGDVRGIVAARDAQVPMGRMGTSFDVANAVLFLLSDNAKYITGQEIVVDGAFVNSTGRA